MTIKHQAAGVSHAPRTAASRRFRLKAATDEAHERVEQIVRSAGMFDSLAGYRRYLQATFEARAEVETELDAGGAQRVLPTWPCRRLAALIAADIADLGEKPHFEKGIRTQQVAPSAELLGRLYVLEGSALGARILTRSADALGLSEAFGARHLHAQSGDVGAWRAFCEVLEATDLSLAEETRLFTAAAQTFDRFAEAYLRAAPLGILA